VSWCLDRLASAKPRSPSWRLDLAGSADLIDIVGLAEGCRMACMPAD
jgi:hypothetical protein